MGFVVIVVRRDLLAGRQSLALLQPGVQTLYVESGSPWEDVIRQYSFSMSVRDVVSP
jgi:hypothetical protein